MNFKLTKKQKKELADHLDESHKIFTIAKQQNDLLERFEDYLNNQRNNFETTKTEMIDYMLGEISQSVYILKENETIK